MRKIISSSIILGILFSFTACDDSPETNENESGSGLKNLINAVNFEQPSVEIKYQGRNSYLQILPKQDNTVINDIIINRGNCPVTMGQSKFIMDKSEFDNVEKFLEKYPENKMLTFADGKFELPQNNVILAYYGLKINEAMLDELITNMPCLNKRGFFYKSNGEMEKFLQDFEKCDEIFEYAKTHSELLAPLLWGHHGRDKLIAIDRLMLNTNNGKKVLAVSGTLYNNDESAKKYLNSLDDDSKSFYQMFFPTRPFKFGELINIPFGTWNDVRINCSSDSVLEVVLKTNGGDFEYKFDR